MAISTAEVRSFPKDEPAKTVADALREVEKAGCRALYAPEFAKARIKEPANPELKRWHQTLTGIYFGLTKFGTEVAIAAHRLHYIANPDNIEAAVNYGLINGAAATPQVAEEIPRLLELEGKDVIVADYKDWEKAKSGLISLKEALNHPTANLILGGRASTEEYIELYHKIAVNKEKIGVWKVNEFKGEPVARLGVCGIFDFIDISAGNFLGDSGRFAGVSQPTGAEGAAPQITALEEIIGKGVKVPGSEIYVIPGPLSPEAASALTFKK